LGALSPEMTMMSKIEKVELSFILHHI